MYALNGHIYAINNFQTCVPFRRDFGVCFIGQPVAPVPVINLECVTDQANILLYCPSNRLIKTDLYISDDKRRDFIAWSTDEARLGMNDKLLSWVSATSGFDFLRKSSETH